MTFLKEYICCSFINVVDSSTSNIFVILQEDDSMTRETIKDELKEIKEAHAADEGDLPFPF